MLESFGHAVHKSADGFGLVAHGLEGGLKFEFHDRIWERAFYFTPKTAQRRSRLQCDNLGTCRVESLACRHGAQTDPA
jgi:hypothetical protein